MNKSNYKNIFRFAVAGLLVLLSICVFFLPTMSARVSISYEDKGSPYTGKVSLSPVQIFDVEQTIAQVRADDDLSVEDLTTKEQIKCLYNEYVLGGENNDTYTSSISVLNTPYIEADNSSASQFVCFGVIFLICAILVLLMNNKVSFAATIIASSYFVIGLISSVFDRANLYSCTVAGEVSGAEFTFYNYGSGAGFMLDIFLIVLIIAASAFAVNLTASKKASTGVVSTGGSTGGSSFGGNSGGGHTSAHQITCVAGEFRGATFAVNEQLTIGRDSNVSNIVVVAPKISRKHCSIRFDAYSNCYYVTDFSTNGTYTANNGARLSHGVETSVPCGTILSLGNNDNQFRLD